MRDGWKRVKLGEIAEVLLGKMLDQKKNRGDYYPFLNNVSVRWGSFDLSAIGKMRFEKDELERYRISKGDIVVCEGGESGRCAMWKCDEPILYQKALHRVRGGKGTDQQYLYYQLYDTFRNGKADALITGTTIKHLPRQALLEVPITLPPLDTQRRIAAVLGALDDKIELNRKMNANLEEQAQALFKSWFVDFDPWGGKMPEGWKTGVAEDFYTIKIGKTPPRKERSLFSSIKAGNVIWVSIADMGNCGMFASDSSEYLVPSAVSDNNVLVSPKGTVLLSFKLTVGRVAIADCPLSSNEAIAHFVPNQEICKEFTYFYLKKFNYEKLGSTSSIATAINSKMVKAIPFVVPDKDTLKLFSASVEPMSSMIRNNLNESRKLAELRDSLLPKLMSGELEVA